MAGTVPKMDAAGGVFEKRIDIQKCSTDNFNKTVVGTRCQSLCCEMDLIMVH